MPSELEIYNNEIFESGNSLIIDPRVLLPKDFPNINGYIGELGFEPVDIQETVDSRRVIFPGGEVQYYLDGSEKSATPSEMIIYGVTVEPGVRALNTGHLDTHISFSTEMKPKKNDLFYVLRDGRVLTITIKEPSKNFSNIRNWWNR